LYNKIALVCYLNLVLMFSRSRDIEVFILVATFVSCFIFNTYQPYFVYKIYMGKLLLIMLSYDNILLR
jgi:hypothetical protein